MCSWQGFGSGGATGVAFVICCQKIFLCWCPASGQDRVNFVVARRLIFPNHVYLSYGSHW